MQVALLKLGLIASLTSFPWEQPAGQLVPVNLRPGGASAPGRLLPTLLEEGGPGSPARVSLLTFLLQELSLKGKLVNCQSLPALSLERAQGEPSSLH